MKLLYCKECHDVVRLFKEERSCECGSTGGLYLDRSKAEVFGDGVPFGILNQEFDEVLRNQPDSGPGGWFRGFVIAKNAPNIVRKDGPRA